jgi:choline dehydrogenase-like flavoprotein
MFIDSNKLYEHVDITTDICIVGSGAAGTVIANEFHDTSTDICLIESGGYHPTEEHQSLYDLDSIGYPMRENFMSRARYYGGTCNIWAGRCMKLQPIDLQKRAWVPHSGWPLSYSELDAYYKKASQALKLPDLSAFKDFTQLPRVIDQGISLFKNKDLELAIALWAKKPLRFGAAYKSAFKKSRNIRVYLNANVTEIVLNDLGNAVEALRVQTLSGKRWRIKAKHFVLACGGLENARLLLVSRQKHAHGVGNHFDVVGRYYMDHPRAIFGHVRLFGPTSLPMLLGLPLADGKMQMGIALSEEAQRRERVLNSYVSLEPQLSKAAEQRYQSSVHFMKILLRKGYAGNRWNFFNSGLAEIRELVYLLTPKEIMPHCFYRPYLTLKRKLSPSVTTKNLTVINYCEQAPNPQSRVFLSEKRDRFQMHSLVLDWKVGAEETRSILRLHELLGKYLVKSGIGILESTLPDTHTLPFTDASHHMGTTRMSAEPRLGVVDNNCRVHSIKNLFIVGSSVFPTAGYANPTPTIVALALRLADHLKTADLAG